MDTQVTQYNLGYESVGRRQVNPVDGAVLAAQAQLDAAWREFYSHVDGREFMDCDEYWEKRAERLEHIDACNIALAEAQKNAEAYWRDNFNLDDIEEIALP